jgi:hypothetical protein
MNVRRLPSMNDVVRRLRQEPVASASYEYERLIGEIEAAQYLGVTPRCLQSWRYAGNGPEFIRAGRKAIRYSRKALDVWIKERTYRCTLEYQQEQ